MLFPGDISPFLSLDVAQSHEAYDLQRQSAQPFLHLMSQDHCALRYGMPETPRPGLFRNHREDASCRISIRKVGATGGGITTSRPEAMELPPILLFDLDDTLITSEQHGPPAWRQACDAIAFRCGKNAQDLYEEIQRVFDAYWSDPLCHRIGRLDLDNTRQRLASQAFANLGVDTAFATEATNAFISVRERRMGLFPGVRGVLAALSTGHRLALVTNGQSHKQRRKIERFALTPFFQRVFIEEEVGVGKPDPAVYRHVLTEMRAKPSDCRMIGDNLSWDVAAPQTLGIHAIWNDWRGSGLPDGSSVRPDRIIRSVAELLTPSGSGLGAG